MDHEVSEPFIREEGDGKLKVGMNAYSEEEAFNMYNLYAFKKGFSIRIGTKRTDQSGQLRQREFLCSKEGFHLDDDLNTTKKWNKLETRTRCKAKIRFNVNNGIWEVAHLSDSHNHEFALPEERHLLRSARKIPNAHAIVLKSMVDARIGPVKSYSFFSQEVGGAKNVGFTKKDCQNFLYRMKGELLNGGDGQRLVNHFKRKQVENPNFFYSVQVDHLNRLTNFFWRDGKSKLDYECFGDVVTFDTTFRTNKYNLICALFVGVNHHWKNVFFGCAFLLDETTESFAWAFDTFLQSMGNRKPKTIFTDEDKAMAKAIDIVLPDVRHRLCTWHIAKKATQHLSGYYSNLEFKKQFNKCFHGCHSEMQFEEEWTKLINLDYDNLGEHWWLKKLYSLRMKWCPAFSLDTFSANIKSTQRSESTNNIFHPLCTKTMNLITFLHHYEKRTEEMRTSELEEDFRCKNGKPHLEVMSEMLSHAATIYTFKLFSLFNREFMSCLGVRVKPVSSFDGVDLYEAYNEGHATSYMLQFSSLTCMVCCTCKIFESMGLLCSHALKVLDFNNVTKIPTQYILKRWSKRAKQGIMVRNNDESSETIRSTQAIRLSDLMHEATNVFNIGSLTENATKFVKRKLTEVMEVLEKDDEIIHIMGISDKVDDQDRDTTNEPPILNPPRIRAKGVTNGRIKSNLEKKRKKANVAINPNTSINYQLARYQTVFCVPQHQPNVLQDSNYHNQCFIPCSSNEERHNDENYTMLPYDNVFPRHNL